MKTTIIKTNRKWYLETVDNLRDLCKVPMRLSVENLIRFVPQFEYLERTKLLSPDMKKFIYDKGIPVFYMENKEIIFMDEIRWNDGTYKIYINRDLSNENKNTFFINVYHPVYASVYDMTPIGVVLEDRF
jgi:hypothetical protein